MTVYLIYYLLIISSAFFSMRYNNGKKKYCILCCVVLTLIVALRSPLMGADLGVENTYGYLNSYHIIGNMSFGTIIKNKVFLNYEMGYILLNKVLYLASSNVELLLIVCATLSIVPVFVLFYYESDSPLISTIVYLGLGLFLISFSGLRQGIAIGICCSATLFIKKRKLIPFVLLVVLAMFFHISAVVFLIAYPIFGIGHTVFSIKNIAILLIGIGIVFILRKPFFKILCRIFRYQVTIDNNGAYRYLFFLIIIFVFLLLFSKQEEQGWMGLVYVACVIQVFSGLNSIVMRVGYYYQIGLMIAIPNVISKINKPRDRLFIGIITVLFFIGYGLYAIKTTAWAKAAPYSFFWISQ